MSRRIPVLIVAGFLGAGKTTLLNRLLRQRAARIGVVVNDFGAVNIDAMLVAGQVDAMVSLGNGCVCCAVDVDELDALFAQLAQPRHRIDVIVVEASGLAEPRNLVRMVAGSTQPAIEYGGLIEVVDAEHFAGSRARHPELAAHLRSADLVVLNKSDRVSAQHLLELCSEISELVDGAPVYPTSHGRLDPALLFDRPEPRPPLAGEQLGFDELLAEHDHHDEAGHPHDASRHPHAAYETVTFTSAIDLDPRRLVDLLTNPPAGLFRAKGRAVFAVAGGSRKFLLHMVGRHLIFEPANWDSGESRTTTLVLIGAGLDTEAALSRLRATEHTGPRPLDEQALLAVFRYVPREPLDAAR